MFDESYATANFTIDLGDIFAYYTTAKILADCEMDVTVWISHCGYFCCSYCCYPLLDGLDEAWAGSTATGRRLRASEHHQRATERSAGQVPRPRHIAAAGERAIA
eukprot:14166931-Heterocapsa_arctica.AAC.1